MRYAGVVIGWLSGIVLERESQNLILDVGGVGYEVTISTEVLSARGAPGDDLALWIHSHATSEHPSPTLFGFTTSDQRKIFRLLLKVKGIGPKVAQAIVGRLGGDGVAGAVREGDVARLKTVPGVGKKTAQQIILDLAGQLAALETAAPVEGSSSGGLSQIASVLINLGFKRAQVDRALRVLRETKQQDGAVDEVIRRALALLREM